jgi:hypothetical protein
MRAAVAPPRLNLDRFGMPRDFATYMWVVYRRHVQDDSPERRAFVRFGLLAVTFAAGVSVGIALGSATPGSAPGAVVRVQQGQSGAPSPVGGKAVWQAARADAPDAEERDGGVPPNSRGSTLPVMEPSASAASVREFTMQGIASWMPERYGPAYLALPIGPGHKVELCGPGGCLVMVSTDIGPSLAMQRAGRAADLAVEAWEYICGLPRSRGLCEISVSAVTYRGRLAD